MGVAMGVCDRDGEGKVGGIKRKSFFLMLRFRTCTLGIINVRSKGIQLENHKLSNGRQKLDKSDTDL